MSDNADEAPDVEQQDQSVRRHLRVVVNAPPVRPAANDELRGLLEGFRRPTKRSNDPTDDFSPAA